MLPPPSLLPSFPRPEDFRPLIELARAEDLGPHGDATSNLLIPDDRTAVGTLYQKEPGVIAGLPLVEAVCRVYDERLRVEQIPGFHLEIIEGRHSDQRQTPLLRIRGPLRSLLSAERVLLNFLQHLSGVATLTQRFVRRVEGSKARIYDTRKTLPGYRALDKYAVRAGGGFNHRIGLYDGILIKDNHLAGLPPRDIAPFLEKLIRRARQDPTLAPAAAQLFEVEVDTLEQFTEVLKVSGDPGVAVIMLDNMDCPRMLEAVRLRDLSAKPVLLEASGGVTLDTVRTIALTGVDRISIGALTHSAPALDISLDIED